MTTKKKTQKEEPEKEKQQSLSDFVKFKNPGKMSFRLKLSNPQKIVISELILIALFEFSIIGKVRELWDLAFTNATPPDYTWTGNTKPAMLQGTSNNGKSGTKNNL